MVFSNNYKNSYLDNLCTCKVQGLCLDVLIFVQKCLMTSLLAFVLVHLYMLQVITVNSYFALCSIHYHNLRQEEIRIKVI